MKPTPLDERSSADPVHETWVDRPVFVTGLMKSGTTLLLALFDGHPALLAYPDEPSFCRLFGRHYQDPQHMLDDWLFGTPNGIHFNQLLQQDRPDWHHDPKSWSPIRPGSVQMTAEQRVAFARRVRLRGLNAEQQDGAFDPVGYHDELERRTRKSPVTAGSLVRASALAAAAASPGSHARERWLFKQPLPRWRRSSVDWFFREFPQGSCVVLRRDPRGFVASLLDYSRARELGGALREWAFLLRRLSHLEEDYERFRALTEVDSRAVLVHYEDLVQRPAETMKALAGSLGLEDHESLSQPTKAAQPARVPTATRDEADRVYTQSAERWRRRLSPVQLALTDAALHRFYGRDPVYRPVVSRPLRLAIRAATWPVLAALRLLPRTGPP